MRFITFELKISIQTNSSIILFERCMVYSRWQIYWNKVLSFQMFQHDVYSNWKLICSNRIDVAQPNGMVLVDCLNEI